MDLSYVVVFAVLVAAIVVAILNYVASGTGVGLTEIFCTLAGIAGACGVVVSLQYIIVRGGKLNQGSSVIKPQRQMQHVASGILILLLFQILSRELSLLALGSAVVAFGMMHCARCWSPEINRQFLASFGSILKESEQKSLLPPGAFYFLLGCFLSALFFSHRLATYTMLCVTLADPSAALGGVLIGGPHLLGAKTFSGFFTCSTVGAAIAFGMAVSVDCSRHEACSFRAILSYGIAAGLGELSGGWFPQLDDNLSASFGTGLIIRFVDTVLFSRESALYLVFDC